MELSTYVSMICVHMLTCLLLCTQLMVSHSDGAAMQQDDVNAGEERGDRYETRHERFYAKYHGNKARGSIYGDDEDMFSGSGSGSGDPYYWENEVPYKNDNGKLDDAGDLYIEPVVTFTERAPALAGTSSSLSGCLATVTITSIACVVIWLNG